MTRNKQLEIRALKDLTPSSFHSVGPGLRSNDLTLAQAVAQLRELLGKPASEGYRDAIRLVLVEATDPSVPELRKEIADLKMWLESAQTERDELRERVGNYAIASH